jgi:hypothetical protein
MTLLTYKDKHVIRSSVEVSTNSTTLVDDTEAVKTFNLDKSQVVLVIYNAIADSEGTKWGKQIAINIDGGDHANTWNSPQNVGYANGLITFWIGTLTAGSHTIKGRFASNDVGVTVPINERVLLIYILDGDEYWYIDNDTPKITDSDTFVDDFEVEVNFNPSADCKVLILYNTGCAPGDSESYTGKKIAIYSPPYHLSQSQKAPWSANAPDNVFTLYYFRATTLRPGFYYTVRGRFATNLAGETVTVSRRQFGVLLFDDYLTLADYIESDVQVTTNELYPVDDFEAIPIVRGINEDRELLVIASATRKHNTPSNTFGETYGIWLIENTNEVEKAKSKGSAANPLANSCATAWAEKMIGPDSYTIIGRFGANATLWPPDVAVVDSRRILALWMKKKAAAAIGDGITWVKT